MKITIFTATYNRANLLKQIYESLLKQKYKKFEWLIVDDGSIDNTYEIVKQFINESKMEINYIKKLNGGIHTAINVGIKNATGELFFKVDDDDFLTDNALLKICHWYQEILKENKNNYAGFSGLCIQKNGKIVGGLKKQKWIDCSNIERKKNKLLGDKAEVYITKILKNYQFPVFKNEKFMTECFVWNKIARDGFKMRWYSEPIKVIEYQKNGLSNNQLNIHLKNFKGFEYYIFSEIKYQDRILSKIRLMANYIYICNLKKIELNKIYNSQKKEIDFRFFKFFISYLISCILIFKHKRY